MGGSTTSTEEGCKDTSVLGVRPGFSYGEEEDIVKILEGCCECGRICFYWNEVTKDTGKIFRGKMDRKLDRRKVVGGPTKGLKIQTMSFHPYVTLSGTQ